MLDGRGPMCRSDCSATTVQCPFMERCWPNDPITSCGSTHRAQEGLRLPADRRESDLGPSRHTEAQRHAEAPDRAMKERRIIVEPGLSEALKAFDGSSGFWTSRRSLARYRDGGHGLEQAPAQSATTIERRRDIHARRVPGGRPKDCRPEWRAHVQATKTPRRSDVLVLRETRIPGTAGSGAGIARWSWRRSRGSCGSMPVVRGTCTTGSSAASVSNTCCTAGPGADLRRSRDWSTARGERRIARLLLCG